MKQTLENFQELSTNQTFLEYIATETPYTYIRTLRKGSASILYLLENRRTREKVILKRMRKKTLKRAKYRARYACELDALQRLELSSIPTVLMSGEVARVPFKLLTYMSGTPLSVHTPYSLKEAFNIVYRVSEQLTHLHRQGFVHGHLTPEHVLIDDQTIQLIGLDHVSTLFSHPTLPYKVKTVAHDIDQLARLFLALTDTSNRFKWKKADNYVMQQFAPSKLRYVLKDALDLTYESVDDFLNQLQQAVQ